MTAQLKTLPAKPPATSSVKSMTELLSVYAITMMKLEAMADEVPQTEQDIENFDKKQVDLLNQKMTLITKAAEQPIQTKADCAAALKFWTHEKMGLSDDGALDPADKMLLSACLYLRDIAQCPDT